MPHSTTEKTSPATALPTKTLKDNVTVPIFPLETISYELIRSGDAAEKERLLAACRYPGFFYLDFRDNNEGRKVLADLKETYRAEGEFFDEHHEKEKMKDIEIKSDDLPLPTSLPEPLHASLPVLIRLSNSLHAANYVLTESVWPSYASSNPSPPLQQQQQQQSSSSGNNTQASAPTTMKSDTALDLIYAPTKALAKDAPDTTHTDGGTMTILLSESWGIKAEDPRSKEWGWCEPREGCGLVNVGDSLAAFSRADAGEKVGEKGQWIAGADGAVGKGLHSCRHAVGQTEDGLVGRVFVVHYLRPGKT